MPITTRRVLAIPGLVLTVLTLTALPFPAQEQSVRPGINDPYRNPDLKKWLATFEGENREVFAQREKILAACKLRPGMSVADIGAGTGLFTRLFAPKVGPKGRVFAVDITPKFIDHIRKSCKDAGLENVTTILCTPSSVELPACSIDLAFLCDVYHHFEFPTRSVQSIHRALRPGGQLILIDFQRIKGKSSDWILNHVRAGQDTFTREIVACGFKPLEEQKFLKENYCVRFEKVEGSGHQTLKGP